jgi:hypothetical protein
LKANFQSHTCGADLPIFEEIWLGKWLFCAAGISTKIDEESAVDRLQLLDRWPTSMLESVALDMKTS